MAPIDDPEDQASAKEDRRQSVSDWLALLALVVVLCLGFVVLVAAGYGLRAMVRSLL